MSVPVLFLIFNRKETALTSLARIREVKPSRLFVAADGPRPTHPGEAERCEEVRRAVMGAIDWECEVKTLFRDHNLGCRKAVSEAITWFFDSVESGIVIEDDCVVSPSFFRFSEELLERYKDDSRILSISANCFQPPGSIKGASYYFSKYQHCWGWASWRRAWKLYDVKMEAWPAFRDSNGLAKFNEGCKIFARHFTRTFDACADGTVDSWAFLWLLTGWENGMLNILPSVNLSTNTGAGVNSTHMTESNDWTANLSALEMPFPLQHPAAIIRNTTADRWSDIHLWHIRWGQPLIHLASQFRPLRQVYHRLLGFRYRMLLRNLHSSKPSFADPSAMAPEQKTLMHTILKRLPPLYTFCRWVHGKLFGPDIPFDSSQDYWIRRYKAGKNSGTGSYSQHAQFKAEVINRFVVEHKVQTIIELGCGDGNQLKLADYPIYSGYDISSDAVERCRKLFSQDETKSFHLVADYRGEFADLALSLDVIFHLVEDAVFTEYMNRLFSAAKKYVIIYSSNSEQNSPDQGRHVRHRRFTDWVNEQKGEWDLGLHIPNRYPYDAKTGKGSFSDFFIYKRRGS